MMFSEPRRLFCITMYTLVVVSLLFDVRDTPSLRTHNVSKVDRVWNEYCEHGSAAIR